MDMAFRWTTRAERLLVADYWWDEQKAVCCLCGDPELLMDPYYRQNPANPFAATLEHLIPKRDDGPDTVGNVRLAHKMCNQALGALWSTNEARAERNLEPLSIEWALARARAQYAGMIALRTSVSVLGHIETVHPTAIAIDLSHRTPKGDRKIKSPVVRYSMEHKGDGRPRGATLPGYVEPVDAGPPTRRAPRIKDLLERQHEKVRRPICTKCGSPEITRDASLKWDRVVGWIIAEHRDGYDCLRCDDSTTVRFEFVNQPSA